MIEKIKSYLEDLRPDIAADTENAKGDEAIYAEGQLSIIDQILEMIEAE